MFGWGLAAGQFPLGLLNQVGIVLGTSRVGARRVSCDAGAEVNWIELNSRLHNDTKMLAGLLGLFRKAKTMHLDRTTITNVSVRSLAVSLPEELFAVTTSTAQLDQLSLLSLDLLKTDDATLQSEPVTCSYLDCENVEDRFTLQPCSETCGELCHRLPRDIIVLGRLSYSSALESGFSTTSLRALEANMEGSSEQVEFREFYSSRVVSSSKTTRVIAHPWP